MSDRHLAGHPPWLREIDAALTVAPSFVLHGNLRDRYVIPDAAGGWQPMDLHGALWDTLSRSGFVAVLRHTPLDVRMLPDTPEAKDAVSKALGAPTDQLSRFSGVDQLGQLMRQVSGCRDARLALAIDYSSQWRPAGQPPSDAEHALMQSALMLVHDAYPLVLGTQRPTGIYNPVLWLVDRPADLPPWLTSGSDGIRQVSVPRPDLDARLQLARGLMPALASAVETVSAAAVESNETAATRFAEHSEGMSLSAMIATIQLALDQGLGPARIEDAVRAYRVGMVENPWARPELRERIRVAEPILAGRVKGQRRAVRHALDILIRSTTGMTGAERGGDDTGPRGILFFAGPTGVGKTELAKQITRLVFGNKSAYVRFDMSEFAAEHTEARLIGSPPGYEGHGEGGELTNAVRQKPFSLILFDEVEKAHPRILDKFLQILSDGRLTDGSGDTVYFGETVIVFTSNLGVPEMKPGEPAMVGDELESEVKKAIEREFAVKINRPELLGRIGDNIVVFDYVDAETARELAGIFIQNVLDRAGDQMGIRVALSEDVGDQLTQLVTTDLSKGGRGISRRVESVLVNPLARALFDVPSGSSVQVTEVVREVGGWYSVRLA